MDVAADSRPRRRAGAGPQPRCGGLAERRDVLVLADVFGATPCNAALAAGRRRARRASSPASTCPCSGARCAIADEPLDELVDAGRRRRRAGRHAGWRAAAAEPGPRACQR
ncbi:MAG: hypothetical protein MZW92_27835 [Comamonadaceae bacterium]|nr:hypothetical protein [Comamonadaceae bacterium]